jgi:hypothetical protein
LILEQEYAKRAENSRVMIRWIDHIAVAVGPNSEVEESFHHWIARGMGQLEAHFIAHTLHVDVLGQDIGRDPVDLLVPAELNQTYKECGSGFAPKCAAPLHDQRF